ncbi:TPA: RNA 3'-phosphate cyclase, partial [Candidatus Woesearchaeota archaeon]|nr:RNA 3'-phosphate cyclase [Candidatus Woesearchaeota archaeon]
LAPSHVTSVEAVAHLCDAEVDNLFQGSKEITFRPGQLTGGRFEFDVGTAGSISLVLQSCLVPAALSKSRVIMDIKGGTDVKWSMPFDYMQEVFVPQMQRYADIELKLVRRGFYPKGQGEVELKVKGKYTLENIDEAPPVRLGKQGHLMQIKGVSFASSELQEAEVAERQQRAARRALAKYDVPIQIRTEYCETASAGTGVVLWAIFSRDPDDIDVMNPIRLGADALGEKGKRAEVVGEEAAKKLIAEIEKGAAVDQHMCDNMIPFVALFGGKMKTSELTKHAKTNVYTVSKFLGERLEVDETKGLIKRV